MKKLIYILNVVLFLLINSVSAQVLTQGNISVALTNSNVLLDGSSSYSTEAGAGANVGKGVIIPSVDLVNFEFDLSLADGFTFPTYFDGMIVYNNATGSSLTSGNRSATAVSLTPGFYYFSNPNGAANANVAGGVWKPLGGGGLTAGTGITIDANGNIVVNDASISSKGIIQLAGDLAGTATAPTVPGLALKAPLASPSFTGVPTAPTAPLGTVSDQLATTSFVNSRPIVIKTGNYTASITDETILCNTTSGAFTLTLPSATTNIGKIYIIRKVDESLNSLTISPVLKVSESTSVTSINFNTSIKVQSNGANWYIVQ